MTSVARGTAPDWLNVSRETLAKLEAMLSLVEKWNPAINLVAQSSLTDGWQRHVLDSAQLFPLIPAKTKQAADLGSGAGFPGLVLAIMAQATMPDMHMTLIESDKRKATFLMQASRLLDVPVLVRTERAEVLSPIEVDLITARAMAPLTALCGLAVRHLAADGLAIFPKGAQADRELAEAATLWRFDTHQMQSQTDPSGRLLALKNIQNA